MGFRKSRVNGHGPIRFTVTIFPRDIKLDKIRIVTNSKAGSCIDIQAGKKIGLDKDAMVGSVDTEDVIPSSNCSGAVLWTRGDSAQNFLGSISSLWSKIKDSTIPSDQAITCNRGIRDNSKKSSSYCQKGPM